MAGPSHPVVPGSNCFVSKTAKFNVIDLPGVAQPQVKKAPPPVKTAAVASSPTSVVSKRFESAKPKTTKSPTATASSSSPSTSKWSSAKSGPPTAELECSCGNVVISLPGPPVHRLECCCIDCRIALEWCHRERKGPSFRDPSVDLIYFPNSVQLEQGGEHLQVFLIAPPSQCPVAGQKYNTHRLVATCCGTAMLGDHPYYQSQNILVTYPDVAELTLKGANHKMILPQRRIHDADLTSEHLRNKLQPLPATCVKVPTPTSSDLHPWKARHPNYTTLQALVRALGPVQYMITDPKFKGKETEFNRQQRLAQSAAASRY